MSQAGIRFLTFCKKAGVLLDGVMHAIGKERVAGSSLVERVMASYHQLEVGRRRWVLHGEGQYFRSNIGEVVTSTDLLHAHTGVLETLGFFSVCFFFSSRNGKRACAYWCKARRGSSRDGNGISRSLSFKTVSRMSHKQQALQYRRPSQESTQDDDFRSRVGKVTKGSPEDVVCCVPLLQ